MARLAPILCAVALLAGCGGGEDEDKEQAEQVVRDFVTATNQRDAETFCGELVTQEFLEQTTGATGDKADDECRRQLEAIQGLEVELVKITRTKLDGDKATVRATIKTQGATGTQSFLLEKEDGEWKLAGGSS